MGLICYSEQDLGAINTHIVIGAKAIRLDNNNVELVLICG